MLRRARTFAAARAARLCLGLALPCWLACHGPGPSVPAHAGSFDLSNFDGSRWQWALAECSDGSLELGRVGLERELTLQVYSKSTLTLIFETELLTEGCYTSAEWLAAHEGGSRFRFEPRSLLSLPPDTECGAVEREPRTGTLRVAGDELEMVTHGSAWCRGFDARFVYRRSDPRRLAPKQIVTRYVGAFNRRDPEGVARLFVESGSLIEPFSRTDDGNYRRHEGRGAIAAWYASAFASTPWSALRLNAITEADDGHVAADWHYMDARLAAPLHGRNLFVIAGGEIYESELQLIDDPEPLRENAPSSAPSTPARAAPTVSP